MEALVSAAREALRLQLGRKSAHAAELARCAGAAARLAAENGALVTALLAAAEAE